MSDTTVQTVTAEPAQVAQTSVEKKGAGNTTQSAFARMLATKQVAPPTKAESAPETPKEPAQAAPAAPEQTEDATATSAEEQPKDTETEEKSDTAEETEGESHEVLSTETNSLDPKLQAKIDRRIGKEVAKRKALEQEVAALKALVTQTPQAEEKEVIVPVPANVPLADITTATQLEQLKQTARMEIRWAEGWLDEEIPAEGIQTDRGHVTKKQLKDLIRNARVVQEDLIPQREKFLTNRQAATVTAFEKFPFLKDPTHAGYQLAQQAKRDNAHWLAGLPNADYIVGVQVKGILAMQAEEAAKTVAKATTTKPKPRPTNGQSDVTSDSSTSRVPVGAMAAQALANEENQLKKKGSLSAKDFAASLVRKSQLRQLSR